LKIFSDFQKPPLASIIRAFFDDLLVRQPHQIKPGPAASANLRVRRLARFFWAKSWPAWYLARPLSVEPAFASGTCAKSRNDPFGQEPDGKPSA
jgi:hypothetical protein